jgi:hypothetical protein
MLLLGSGSSPPAVETTLSEPSPFIEGQANISRNIGPALGSLLVPLV